jgi:hypothetical protein
VTVGTVTVVKGKWPAKGPAEAAAPSSETLRLGLGERFIE